MNIEDLSPEILQNAKACKTPEELFALAREEGIELTEEELDAISGGPLPFPEGSGSGQSGWFRRKD